MVGGAAPDSSLALASVTTSRFLLQLPFIMDCGSDTEAENKPFPPQVTFVHGTLAKTHSELEARLGYGRMCLTINQSVNK